LRIEGIGEIVRVGNREVTETVEVFLQLRHATDLTSLPGIKEASETMPRGGGGVVGIDGYDS
jgi:hypothetical protein